MEKTGNMLKRGIYGIALSMLIFSAKRETVDTLAASSTLKMELRQSNIYDDVEEVEQVQFVSIVQEEKLLAKLKENLFEIEQKMDLLFSNDCAEMDTIEVEIEAKLFEMCQIQQQLSIDMYSVEIESAIEKLLAIKGARSKLSNYEVTYDMDMSNVIGLNVEEVKYILLSVKKDTGEHLLTDEVLAGEMANVIVEGANHYQVNELFTIAVIIWETGWLTNDNAHNNNFGSVKNKTGEFAKFSNVRDGILVTISSIRNNMRGNNTSSIIAKGYCKMSEEENLLWARSTVSLMRKCSKFGGG